MPQIVSVSSLKGGVGKTSVTLGLASAALARGLKTLVIDLDPHGDSSTGLAISAAEGTDIGTMLATVGNCDFSAGLVASGWNTLAAQKAQDAAAAGSVLVARGSASSTALEALSPQETLPRLSQLIRGDIDIFDLVLIDCPPTLGRLTSMAWAASDKVISVAEPSLFSVAGTERTLRAIARFEANTEYSVDSASVVINKVRSGNPEHSFRVEEMKTIFGDLVAEPSLPDFDSFQQIQGAAFPVHYWPGQEAQEFAQNFSSLLAGLSS